MKILALLFAFALLTPVMFMPSEPAQVKVVNVTRAERRKNIKRGRQKFGFR